MPVSETPAPPETPVPTRRRGRQRRTDADAAANDAAAAPAKTAPPAPAEPAAPPSRRVRGVPRRREVTAVTGTEQTAGSETTGQTARAGVPAAPLELLPPPYQSLPDEVLANLPLVQVKKINNRPTLTVNGEMRLPLWFFVNTQDPDALPVAVREIRMAYEAGIRFFTLLTNLPWKARTGERRFGPLDEILALMAENAPDALLMPRLVFSPPTSWERAHPDEMSRYQNGETGEVSIASRAFWDEADETLRAAIEYAAQSPHASRIGGFYLEHGEWLNEKGRGPDMSAASTKAFRDWLKAKYKAVVNLRAAWHDGAVTFENAPIPPSDAPASPTRFWSDRQQKWADFAQFTSETTASVIVRLAKSVKEASGNRSAAAASYGYCLEVMRGNSGHLDLARVLASPHIDILTGPLSYEGRAPGGSAPFPAPVDSVHLAGKLWVSEDDTKTFLASGETPDTYNGQIAAPEGTWAAHSRNFGAALAKGAGLSWMDLWGEGWLDDRYVWQNIAHLNDIAARVAGLRQREAADETAPDVAVIVDETSFFDIPPQSEGFLSQLVAGQRDALLRSGAKIGFYLLSDLLNPDFPQSVKLLLFLNAFHLPDTLRAAIKTHQHSGKTLAWLFGPGCRDEAMGDGETVGMTLKKQPWGSKTGTLVLSNVRSPLTENMRGQTIGDDTRTNPSYYVSDPKAQILGQYDGGAGSLAVRKHGQWQSVFIAEPALTLPLVRGLFRLANVPMLTVDDDAAVLGDNLLSLHSSPGGGTTVYLPDDLALFDLLTNEPVSAGGFGARLSMPPKGTRLLFAGAPALVRMLGGDPDAAPMGLSEDELPAPPPAFVFDTPPPSVPAPVSSIPVPRFTREAVTVPPASPEDADLMEAAFTSGDFSETDKSGASGDMEADDEPELSLPDANDADSKRKRRRRRRGPSRAATEAAPEETGDDTASVRETVEAPISDLSDAGDADANANAMETEPRAETQGTGETEETGDLFAAAPTARLTLDELLPQSTLIEETGELPPIPDELLPLDTRVLSAQPAQPAQTVMEAEVGGQASAAETEAGNNEAEPELPLSLEPEPETAEAIAEEPPRRRRGRPRRTPPATQ